MLHSTIKQYTKLGSANSFMQENYHSIIIPNAGNFFPAITPYKCTSCCTQCVIHTYILYISTSLLDALLFFITILQFTCCSWGGGGVPGGTEVLSGMRACLYFSISTYIHTTYKGNWLINSLVKWYQLHFIFTGSYFSNSNCARRHGCKHAQTHTLPGLLSPIESVVSCEFDYPWPSSAKNDTHASSGMKKVALRFHLVSPAAFSSLGRAVRRRYCRQRRHTTTY